MQVAEHHHRLRANSDHTAGLNSNCLRPDSQRTLTIKGHHTFFSHTVKSDTSHVIQKCSYRASQYKQVSSWITFCKQSGWSTWPKCGILHHRKKILILWQITLFLYCSFFCFKNVYKVVKLQTCKVTAWFFDNYYANNDKMGLFLFFYGKNTVLLHMLFSHLIIKG